MSFDNFNQRKIELMNATDELIRLSEDLHSTEVQDKLNQCKDHMLNDAFSVVVVGQFSRGKSTFVNALLGQRILPTSKKPTTAVISKIAYSPEPQFTVHFKDGHATTIDEQNFFGIKAPGTYSIDSSQEEREHILDAQEHINTIDYVQVGYPLDFCKNSVELVDTPGTDDLNESRIEITYNYLNRADAVILLLAADQALSSGEVEFLKERILKQQIRDIFYIINRKDTLAGPDEEERVRQFVTDNLKQIVGDSLTDIKPHLVSSYQALLYRRNARGESLSGKQLMNIPESFAVTGFDELEDALRTYLTVDKGQARIALYSRKLEYHMEELLKHIREQQQFLGTSLNELNEIVQNLAYQEREYVKTTDAIIERLRISLDQYKGQLKNKAAIFGGTLINVVCGAIQNYSGSLSDQAFTNHIDAIIRRRQKEFFEELHNYIGDIVNAEYEQVLTNLRNVWADFEGSFMPRTFGNHGRLSSQLQLNLPGNFKEIRNDTFEKEDNNALGWVVAATVLGAVVGSFIPLIAGGIYSFFATSGDVVDDKVKNSICEEITVKLKENNQALEGKVLSIYESVCSDIIDSLHKDVTGQLKSLHDQLTEAIRVKERDEQEVAAKSQRLTSSAALLDEINRRIKAVALLTY